MGCETLVVWTSKLGNGIMRGGENGLDRLLSDPVRSLSNELRDALLRRMLVGFRLGGCRGRVVRRGCSLRIGFLVPVIRR